MLFPTLSRHRLLRFAHLTSADLSALRHRARGGGRVRSRPRPATEPSQPTDRCAPLSVTESGRSEGEHRRRADIRSPNLNGSSPTDSGRRTFAASLQDHSACCTQKTAIHAIMADSQPHRRAAPPTADHPARDDAPEPTPDRDLLGQSEPHFEFDQRVAWSPVSAAGGSAAATASRPSAVPGAVFKRSSTRDLCSNRRPLRARTAS